MGDWIRVDIHPVCFIDRVDLILIYDDGLVAHIAQVCLRLNRCSGLRVKSKAGTFAFH